MRLSLRTRTIIGTALLVVLVGGIYFVTQFRMKHTFSLSSSAFENNGMIPRQYTCDAKQPLSPPLTISGAPEGTKSFALVMDDPDIPQEVKQSRGIEVFDHWVAYGIPAGTTEIPEGIALGTTGLNGAGAPGYTGPCPPPQYEPAVHRYFFTLYALSGNVNFIKVQTKAELLTAIAPLTIGKAELIGRYTRR